MIILISPAKSLNFERTYPTTSYSKPTFEAEAKQLAEVLKKKSAKKLMQLMDISQPLADLNVERNQQFQFPLTPENAKPAIFAFDGDVYQGLDAMSLSALEIDFAQAHLRILSGLYGCLKPLDLIQPYRLEMGTALSTRKGKNLYAFWGEKILKHIEAELHQQSGNLVLNLASDEYAKAAKLSKVRANVVSPVFKEMHQGKLKFISFNAKKARGLMARYAIQTQAQSLDQVLSFNLDGYQFQAEGSTAAAPLFTR